jgi:hypothetical protein
MLWHTAGAMVFIWSRPGLRQGDGDHHVVSLCRSISQHLISDSIGCVGMARNKALFLCSGVWSC